MHGRPEITRELAACSACSKTAAHAIKLLGGAAGAFGLHDAMLFVTVRCDFLHAVHVCICMSAHLCFHSSSRDLGLPVINLSGYNS